LERSLKTLSARRLTHTHCLTCSFAGEIERNTGASTFYTPPFDLWPRRVLLVLLLLLLVMVVAMVWRPWPWLSLCANAGVLGGN
jgi:hypothetical protein